MHCRPRPPAKVDTAALGIVPGAPVAPPVKQQPMPHPRPSPPQCSPTNQPTGQVIRVPVPAVTHLYVQVGAFSKLENAKALLAKLGGDLRISTLQRGGQTLYRVRTGAAGFGRRMPMPRWPASPARAANDAHIVVDQ